MKNDIRGCINNINKWVSDNYVEKNIVTLMDETFIHYDPLGVVLIMGAWNYPLMLSLGPIGTQEAVFCHILITLLLILATKLRRLLSEDQSSSSVHFQTPKNLRSFKYFRPKIVKILWENLTICWTKLSEKVQKYVLFLTLNFNFPHIKLSSTAGKVCSICCLKENF